MGHDYDVLKKKYSVEKRPTRQRIVPESLAEFIVDAPIETRLCGGIEDCEDVIRELRNVIVELSDNFEREMDTRFTTENTDLWSSMDALSFKHTDYLNPSLLQPLFEYMLTIPVISDFLTLKSECKVLKNVILRDFEGTENVDVAEIYMFLSKNYSEAAPVLTSMYKLSVMFLLKNLL